MYGNPLKYNDPSGHTVACENGTGENGCDGYNMLAILLSSYDMLALDEAIMSYIKRYPNYNPGADPFLEGDQAGYIATFHFRCHSDPACLGTTQASIDQGLATIGLATLAIGGVDIGDGSSQPGGTLVSEAVSAANGVRFGKSMASERQMAEAITGGGHVIAGAPGMKEIDVAPRLVTEYGGEASGWRKMSSSGYLAEDGTGFQIHWYENAELNLQVEYKTKFADGPLSPKGHQQRAGGR